MFVSLFSHRHNFVSHGQKCSDLVFILRSILPSYLFGQPCIFGQYGNDAICEPAHVLIPSNFTLQYFNSQQIKENAKE